MSKARELIKQLGSKQAATDTLSKSENNDCVVRAVQHAFGVDYIDAHHFCETKLNRKSGQGTYTGIYLPKIKQAFGQKINRMGKDGRITRVKKSKVTRWSNEKSAFVKKRVTLQVRYKVKDFVKKFSVGKYIVIVRGHAFAKVIGNLEDSGR
jgi:hypothetical protein